MVEATDSFVKGMLKTIVELGLLIAVAVWIGHWLEVFNVFEYF